MIEAPEVGSVVVSVVSHGHGELVARLLEDLERYCSGSSISVVLTLNVGEGLPFAEEDFGFPLKVVRNRLPQGFGANHNAAFCEEDGGFFCVLNPDIRLDQDPFSRLLESLTSGRAGAIAPLVINETGEVEDSFRRLPTPVSLFAKALGLKKKPDYEAGQSMVRPDWIAGMFMLFPSAAFGELGGFDERYFLYYEDVDLCTRARLAGYEVLLDPAVAVVHEARRESHRDLKFLRWHLASALRFFASNAFVSDLRVRATRKLRSFRGRDKP